MRLGLEMLSLEVRIAGTRGVDRRMPASSTATPFKRNNLNNNSINKQQISNISLTKKSHSLPGLPSGSKAGPTGYVSGFVPGGPPLKQQETICVHMYIRYTIYDICISMSVHRGCLVLSGFQRELRGSQGVGVASHKWFDRALLSFLYMFKPSC